MFPFVEAGRCAESIRLGTHTILKVPIKIDIRDTRDTFKRSSCSHGLQ